MPFNAADPPVADARRRPRPHSSQVLVTPGAVTRMPIDGLWRQTATSP